MVAAPVMAAVFVLLFAGGAEAHTVLTASDPPEGSMLDSPPSTIRLSFAEPPEVSLSQIRVTDSGGGEHGIGRVASAPDTANTIEIPVRGLEKSVYTVGWRAVSKVDGHPAAGSFEFGVGVLPGLPELDEGAEAERSNFEVLARWILLVGLVALLGAAVAGASGFGADQGGTLGWAGLGMSVLGLGLLAEAQRRGASASFGGLMETTIGRALVGRAMGIGIAGLMLFAAHKGPPRFRKWAMYLAATGAAGAIAAHAAAGHAASDSQLTVLSQWAHFAAAGVWIGGLAALLLAIRGGPSDAKTVMARRFSRAAGAALVVVVATGVLRSLGELNSWDDLITTGYGRAVLAKIGLVAVAAGLGAFNRWRNLPRSTRSLSGLRRASLGEVFLATIALAAAAFLGASSPPVAARSVMPGISVSGSDFATSLRVRLSALSPRPGPNRFTVEVVDYDSGKPVRGDVTLRFLPLDDPSPVPSGLVLERRADGSYAGVGSNLAFDGRWRVTASIQTEKESVTVPLELAVEKEPQHLSVLREMGEPAVYTVELPDGGSTIFKADPDRAGPSRISAGFYDFFGSEISIPNVVLTTSSSRGSYRQQEVRRLGPGSFATDLVLPQGRVRVTVAGRTPDGTRLSSAVDLDMGRQGAASGTP